jgi:hypothetical protein
MQRAQHAAMRRFLEDRIVAPIIPTYRTRFTPARAALALAALAVIVNLYLMFGAALAAPGGVARASVATACDEAVRGRFPGELPVDGAERRSTQ